MAWKWLFWKNYILNDIIDNLYDCYNTYKPAKYISKSLKVKYDNDEIGVKMYVWSRCLKCNKIDEQYVEFQSHKIQKITHGIIIESMTLNKKFQTVVIIEKLSAP